MAKVVGEGQGKITSARGLQVGVRGLEIWNQSKGQAYIMEERREMPPTGSAQDP